MNPCIEQLLTDCNASTKLVTGLPKAFEMASLELPGNPAVGFLREHAITGFFKNHFKDNITVPTKGNDRGFDIKVCGHGLSIKTVTGDGGVKVLWTVDTDSVKAEIAEKYKPTCDILLVKIFWGEHKESVFYIPKEAQLGVFKSLGAEKYLSSATSTNNRGIEIRRSAIKKLQEHEKTKKLWVDWQKLGLEYTPYDRWEQFWETVTID